MMAGMLAEIAPVLAAREDRFILVSMAAGLTMADIRRLAGGDYPVIRIMPNTPVAVGQGVILYDSVDVTEEELAQFCKNLSQGGLLDPLPEHLIDAGSAVAGCGPAFADLFLEALADGGVANGLPRAKAMAYAAQMLLGAAALQLESGSHPGQLKDAVCSPGGSTIAGVRALEQRAFRAAVMEAVDAAVKRTKELGK
jgi:pyrroline-5-carboxylate reductase